MESIKEIHYKARKRILRYIKGTIRYAILYNNLKHDHLVSNTYNDFVRSINDKNSTLSYAFHLGIGLIS